MLPVRNELLDGLVSAFALLSCGYMVSVQGWISFRRGTHNLLKVKTGNQPSQILDTGVERSWCLGELIGKMRPVEYWPIVGDSVVLNVVIFREDKPSHTSRCTWWNTYCSPWLQTAKL